MVHYYAAFVDRFFNGLSHIIQSLVNSVGVLISKKTPFKLGQYVTPRSSQTVLAFESQISHLLSLTIQYASVSSIQLDPALYQRVARTTSSTSLK